jgi:hypothetical protein
MNRRDNASGYSTFSLSRDSEIGCNVEMQEFQVPADGMERVFLF